MALGLPDLLLLQRLRTQGYLPDRCAIAEIGAQQIDDSILDSQENLLALAQAFGITAPCPTLIARRPADAHHRLMGLPMSRELWEWLGLRYLAVDIDGSQDSLPLDLNCDEIPPALKGLHHLVTNFGTTEHVANQANAFKIIHDLTAVGGVMVHTLPYQLVDHGLVNYTRKFFWMLCRSNEYRLLHMSDVDNGEQGIGVVMQKQHALDFVPPLDVENGTTTDNEALNRRYWTVFQRKAIESIAIDRETELKRRRQACYDREQSLQARDQRATEREQSLQARDQRATERERLLERREERILERERMLELKEQQTSASDVHAGTLSAES